MKKIGVLGILCLLLLSGCSRGNPLPEGMEEDALLQEGWAVVDQMIDGEYQAVADQFREDVEVSAEALEELLTSVTADAGDYVQHEDGMVTGQESHGEEYGVAVLLCEYRKDTILFRVAFDPDMKLIGMSIEEK